MGLLAWIRLSYDDKKVDKHVTCRTDNEDLAKELVKNFVHEKYPKAKRYKILELENDGKK